MKLHTVRNFLFATGLFSLAVLPASAQLAPAMAVDNFKNGESIQYSAPLIIGTLPDATADSVTLINTSSKRPTREMKGLANKGKFKVLADLVPGANDLTITAGTKTTKLKLNFVPQTSKRAVRAIYYTDNTGDAKLASPDPNDKQDVVGRLGTAMLLMQSFTADRMSQHGYGRKTFNVELDAEGRPLVFIVKGHQEPNTGYNDGSISRAIATQASRPHTHYLVMLGRGCGYTAIGGNGKAIMGGDTIYTWPSSIQTAQAAFMDATPIDSGKFHVDAIGRDTYWANSSTTIGACLHEIGHSFGLPHSMDGLCIMTRGHDHFNRFFTLVEPPSKANAKPIELKDSDAARFCKVTANNLAISRYMALNEREYVSGKLPTIKFDPVKNEITVASEVGIGFIALDPPYGNPGADYCIAIDPSKPAPKEVVIKAKEWERFGGKPFQVRVSDIDSNGNVDREPLKAK